MVPKIKLIHYCQGDEDVINKFMDIVDVIDTKTSVTDDDTLITIIYNEKHNVDFILKKRGEFNGKNIIY